MPPQCSHSKAGREIDTQAPQDGRFHGKPGCTSKSPFEPKHGFQRQLATNLDSVLHKGERLGN